MTTSIRITLEIDRADCPQLFDELVQFPKGPRRVNRLRTLALIGYIQQGAAHAMGEDTLPSDSQVDPERHAASLDLFGPSVDAA